jgi:hypothetical protein
VTDSARPPVDFLSHVARDIESSVTRDILGPAKWIVSERAVAFGGSSDDQLRCVA